MKNLRLVILFLFSVQVLLAQHFVALDDASGVNTAPYQTDLEAAAAELVQILPQEFQSQFKVYDFGFYLHHENFEGGYPDIFAQKLLEIEQLSPYYLVFGKQSDRTGIYTKFWVDLKLPTEGQFECLDLIADNYREQLESRIKNQVDQTYDLNNNEITSYSLAEIAGINELKNQLTSLWDCCQIDEQFMPNSCSPCFASTGYDVLRQMIDLDFVAEEISILDDPDWPDNTDPTLRSSDPPSLLTGDLNLTISFDDSETVDLDAFIDADIIDKQINYYNAKYGASISVGKHIFKYPRECTFEESYAAYQADQSDLKLFIGVINIDNQHGLLVYKFETNIDFREEADQEIVVGAVNSRIDEIGSLTSKDITQLTMIQVDQFNGSNFDSFASIEDQSLQEGYNWVKDYMINKRNENENAYTQEFGTFWNQEYNYGISFLDEIFTEKEIFAFKTLNSINLICGNISAASSYEEYGSLREQKIVLELILKFACTRSRGENSFSYLKQEVGYFNGIFRRSYEENIPEGLLEILTGINIEKVTFKNTTNSVHIVDINSVVNGTRTEYISHFKELVAVERGEITIRGVSSLQNFECIIITENPLQSILLTQIFNGEQNSSLPTINYSQIYNNQINTLNQLGNSSQSSCDNSTAKQILAYIPSCALEGLSNEARVNLVNCLTNEIGVDEIEETYVVKLFDNVENACDLIQQLEQRLELEDLIESIDHEAPVKALAGNLIKIFRDCNQYTGISEENVEGEVVLVIDPGNLFQSNTFSYEEISGSYINTIKLKKQVSTLTEHWYVSSSPYEIGTYRFFTPIHLISNLNRVEDLGIQGQVELLNVPAILAPVIINSYNQQVFYDQLSTTFDIILLSLGVIELRLALAAYRTAATAANMARLGLALADFGAALADQTCKNSPNAEFCKEWNQVKFYVSAGLITANLYDISSTVLKTSSKIGLLEGFADYPNVKNLIKDGKNFDEQSLRALEKLVAASDPAALGRLEADLVANSTFRAHISDNANDLAAWSIANKHNDAIRTNIPFLTRFSNDIRNPQFPAGSSSTKAELLTALDNPDIFSFYKRFENSSNIGTLMRKRYLEAITLPDGLARKAILDAVLDQKISIRQLGILSDELLENLSNSNLADGFATFTVNGSTVQIDFVSISGIEPSSTLIDAGQTAVNSKQIVPRGGSNSKRFFKWNNPQRAQDSEAKILEYIMDQVAAAKGINIPQGANKANYIDEVLEGSNLQITIRSEMEACSSCADVISAFNSVNSTAINFSGGTKFYEQTN